MAPCHFGVPEIWTCSYGLYVWHLKEYFKVSLPAPLKCPPKQASTWNQSSAMCGSFCELGVLYWGPYEGSIFLGPYSVTLNASDFHSVGPCNTRYLPKTITTIPNAETLNTLYMGSLGP